jgi:hypothetical protein
MSDLDLLTQAMLMTGGNPAILFDTQTAHLLVSCHRVMSQHEVPDITILRMWHEEHDNLSLRDKSTILVSSRKCITVITCLDEIRLGATYDA